MTAKLSKQSSKSPKTKDMKQWMEKTSESNFIAVFNRLTSYIPVTQGFQIQVQKEIKNNPNFLQKKNIWENIYAT